MDDLCSSPYVEGLRQVKGLDSRRPSGGGAGGFLAPAAQQFLRGKIGC